MGNFKAGWLLIDLGGTLLMDYDMENNCETLYSTKKEALLSIGTSQFLPVSKRIGKGHYDVIVVESKYPLLKNEYVLLKINTQNELDSWMQDD